MPDLQAVFVNKGLFKHIELVGMKCNANNVRTISIPEQVKDLPEGDVSLRSVTLHVRDCENIKVDVNCKVKVIKLEKCAKIQVQVSKGTVASVELIRCTRSSLHIQEPISSLHVDDSNSTTVHLSWLARCGYIDDSDSSSGTTKRAGFRTFSSGSHDTNVVYPVSQDPDASTKRYTLPEAFLTSFPDPQEKVDDPGQLVEDGNTPLDPVDNWNPEDAEPTTKLINVGSRWAGL